jgi:hypothetical protein
MIPNPLGKQGFGGYDFGNGVGHSWQKFFAALPISYATVAYASTCLITYAIQVPAIASLMLTYQIAPLITDFSINGVLVARPNTMNYGLPGTIGSDIDGVPIIQGYASVSWQYDVLSDSAIGLLMALYNPVLPEVTITYPNEMGSWVTKKAMFTPPVLGTRSTVIHSSVTLTFIHIKSD